MAKIFDIHGMTIAEGLQGCNICDDAIHTAKRLADRLSDDVHLVDDDGEWIVHPLVEGKREPADPLSPART